MEAPDGLPVGTKERNEGEQISRSQRLHCVLFFTDSILIVSAPNTFRNASA